MESMLDQKVRAYKAVLDRKDELAELTKENNAEKERLEQEICQMMVDEEKPNTVVDGFTYSLQQKVMYSKKSEEALAEAGIDFFDVLREQGLGDLIVESQVVVVTRSACEHRYTLYIYIRNGFHGFLDGERQLADGACEVEGLLLGQQSQMLMSLYHFRTKRLLIRILKYIYLPAFHTAHRKSCIWCDCDEPQGLQLFFSQIWSQLRHILFHRHCRLIGYDIEIYCTHGREIPDNIHREIQKEISLYR